MQAPVQPDCTLALNQDLPEQTTLVEDDVLPTNFWITAQQFTYLNSSMGLGTAVDFKQLFPSIDTFRR